MITTAIVTKVFKSDKDKAGVAYKTKAGKPYSKIGIKTDKTADVWYSTLLFNDDAAEAKIKEGDECQFVFEDNGTYKNFHIASKYDIQDARITALEQQVKQLVHTSKGITSAGTPVPFPEDNKVEDVNPLDIPF